MNPEDKLAAWSEEEGGVRGRPAVTARQSTMSEWRRWSSWCPAPAPPRQYVG